MTIATALGAAADVLARAGIGAARSEAEQLLGDLLGTDRGGLLVRRGEALGESERRGFEGWVARRARREPVQYIVGRVEFRGLDLQVDPRVLIPRPETEGLVEAALAEDPPRGGTVVDAGTGSGCVAIALAVARPDLRVCAIDRSAAAIAVARENARIHRVEERVRFDVLDFGDPPAAWDGLMDLLVANPPYVTRDEWAALEPEVRDHEPRDALVPGPTGLEAHATLATTARRILRPGGSVILEVGWTQAEAVGVLLGGHGFEAISTRRDFAGIARVVVARAPDGRSR